MEYRTFSLRTHIRVLVIASVLIQPILALGGPSNADATRLLLQQPLGFSAGKLSLSARGLGMSAVIGKRGGIEITRGGNGKSWVAMEFLGGSKSSVAVLADELPGTVNYIVGSDPVDWHTGARLFRKVRIEGVYPGVNVVYYGTQEHIEFDLEATSAKALKEVRIKFHGASGMRMTKEGGVQFCESVEELILGKPFSYEMRNSKRHEVRSRYRLYNGVVSIEADAEGPVTVDPVISSLQTVMAQIFATAVDASGSLYLTGTTGLITLPTALNAPLQSQYGDATRACEITRANPLALSCQDAFVFKLTPDGTGFVYATYLGGLGFESGQGIAVDASGNAVITGSTYSKNFPVTAHAYQTVWGGSTLPNQFTPWGDVFVTKLNAAGTGLIFSTFLGGPGADVGWAVSLGLDNSVWVTGKTDCCFPVTSGTVNSLNKPSYATFVSHLSSDGTKLIASVVRSDEGVSLGNGIGISTSGEPYVVELNDTIGSPPPTFLSYTQDLTQLHYKQTFPPGTVLAVPPNGSPDAFFALYGNHVQKSRLDGSLLFDRDIGIGANTLVSDLAGNVYVAVPGGTTPFAEPYYVIASPATFPYKGKESARCDTGASSAYLAFDPTMTQLIYATPGSGGAGLLSAGPPGVLYDVTRLFGAELEKILRITTVTGDSDALPHPGCILNAASLKPFGNALSYAIGTGFVSPGEVISIFGSQLGPQTGVASVPDSHGNYPVMLGGVRVLFDGVPAPMLYASATQLNLLVPFGVGSAHPGSASVTVANVERDGAVSEDMTLDVVTVTAGIFTYSANGTGQIAALNQDGTLNSADNPAHAGSIVSIWATGLGAVSPAPVDGSTNSAPLGVLTSGIQVLTDFDQFVGPKADIQYAGPAPGLVAGAMQVNFRVPAPVHGQKLYVSFTGIPGNSGVWISIAP